MTRQEIKSAIRLEMGEVLGDEMSGDPFSLDRQINTAADELARATDCHWVTAQTEVTAQVAEYCAPQIYKLKGVFWGDSTGDMNRLVEIFPWDMDRLSSAWRNDSAGDPQWYVVEGVNRARLYNRPSTSSTIATVTDLVIGSTNTQVTSAARPFSSSDVGRWLIITAGTNFTTGPARIVSVSGVTAQIDRAAGTASSTGGTARVSYGGLWIEGNGVPGDTWSAESAECPLPETAHPGVIWRVCMLRSTRYDPQRRVFYQEEYKQVRGMLESETALHSAAGRSDRVISRGIYVL